MRISKLGYSPRQHAYARKLLNGAGKSKKEIALSVGYNENTANSLKLKVENRPGFKNAVRDLSQQSGEMMTEVFAALKGKDLSQESTETLLKAVTVIANAWETFTPKHAPEMPQKANNLKVIFQNHAQNQTIQPVQETAETIQAQPMNEEDQEQPESTQ